jgi:hypothetical protein
MNNNHEKFDLEAKQNQVVGSDFDNINKTIGQDLSQPTSSNTESKGNTQTSQQNVSSKENFRVIGDMGHTLDPSGSK